MSKKRFPPRRKPEFKAFAICPDPELITVLKTFHIQTISEFLTASAIISGPGKVVFIPTSGIEDFAAY